MSTREPGRPGRDDEVDERFRAIMDAEFGASPAPREQEPRPTGEVPTGGADFNLTAALDEVSPDELAEPFVAPTPSPLPRLRGMVAVGVTLMALGLLVTLAALLGIELNGRWGAWAVAAMVVGLGILLFSIPRTPRDPWDDGTRI